MNASGSGIGLTPLMMAMTNASNTSNGEAGAAVESFSTVFKQYQITPLSNSSTANVGEQISTLQGQTLPLIRQGLSLEHELTVADLLNQRDVAMVDELSVAQAEEAMSFSMTLQLPLATQFDQNNDMTQLESPLSLIDADELKQDDSSEWVLGSMMSADHRLASAASVNASAHSVNNTTEYRAPTASGLLADSSVDDVSNGQYRVNMDMNSPDILATRNSATQANLTEMPTNQDLGAWQTSVVLDNSLTSTSAKTSAGDVSLQQQLAQADARLNFGRDTEQWTPALGGRILAMVADGIQEARIHLDPPELGSLEIRMRIQNDQATVQIQVQTPQVRDVLESQAQRLRDALAEQGLQLAGFDVGEQRQQGFANQAADPQWEQSADGELTEDNEGEAIVQQSTHRGLLDTFA